MRRAFERFGNGAGYEIVPLAANSYGWLGKEAAQFLNDIGDVAAADGRASIDAFVMIVHQELSCALCRNNACMYDRSLIPRILKK